MSLTEMGGLKVLSKWLRGSSTEKSTNKPFQRCVIHIGTEKTGSSAIQSFLSGNHEALEREGFFYPDFGNGGSQWEFVAAVHETPWKDETFQFRLDIKNEEDHVSFQESFSQELTKQISSARAQHTLIISSEHFHSRLQNIEAIERLRSFLEAFADEFLIVVYLRRQDRVFVSLNSTRVKSGGHNPNLRFPTSLDKVHRYYRYEKIYADWSRVFGADAMRPKRYLEKDFDPEWIIGSFCTAIGIDEKNKVLPGRTNTSLNQIGLQLIGQFNAIFDEKEISKQDPVRSEIIQYISDIYIGKHYTVTRQDAVDFYAMFEEANKQLAEQVASHFEMPVFDDAFDEYPEEVDMTSLSVDETIRLALDLYRFGKDQNPSVSPINRIKSFVGDKK